MDDSTDRTLDAVGPRLKQLRQRRDITLHDLAAETGISTSTLSRLEAGLRRPTLEQLLPLARAYGVTLDELVDAPPTGDPRVNLRPIPTSDGRTVLPLSRRPGGIQAYKFVLPAGRDDAEPDLRTGTLISLLQATSAWSTALPKEVRGGLKGGDIKRRAKEIAKGRWGSEAVRKAVEATNAAMMVAIYS